MWTPPGRRRASPGATTTAPPASAWSAKARACASNAASPAPMPIHIWRSPRAWLPGSTASPTRSSRRNASSAMCMPRATCSGCRTRSRNRSRDSRGASSPSAPSVPRSSSTTRTSSAPRWLPSTRRSPTGNARGTSRGSDSHPMRLKDKVALITGAGSGIGRQAALLFSRKGAAVLVVDVNGAGSNETVAMVKQAGGRAAYCTADVSKAGDCQNMVDAAEKNFGKLNVLFNNAGIMHPKDDDAVSTDEAVWDLTLDINAKGVFLGCKYGIPALKRAGGGSVINTASFVARLGAATPQIAYTASKGAVLAMTRELAVIHARQNIRVNALSPGPLRTELLMSYLNTEEKRRRRLVHVPMGRFGDAKEIAQAALYLASDESSYVTGTEFLVDGGLTAAYVTPE